MADQPSLPTYEGIQETLTILHQKEPTLYFSPVAIIREHQGWCDQSIIKATQNHLENLVAAGLADRIMATRELEPAMRAEGINTLTAYRLRSH